MTQLEARRLLFKWKIGFAIAVLTPICLVGYGLAHPTRHKTLLLVLGMMIAPLFLMFLIEKSGRAGVLSPRTKIATVNMSQLLETHPRALFVAPFLLFGICWGLPLSSLYVKSSADRKAWVGKHPVMVLCWVFAPSLLLAYLCIRLQTPSIGVYEAICTIYSTVFIAVGGLQLESGVVKFFGTYKVHASPLVILTLASFCCLAYGALHYALWSIWPSEYVNLHGAEDAIYFSVVTMATVGYGDILPVGHLARWLSISEILSGVLLLVVGVSASMTIWLQTNQPTQKADLTEPSQSSAPTNE